MTRDRVRVTFVLPHADLSGGVRVIAIYANALQDRGHEVLVISQPQRTMSWRERARAALTGRFPHSHASRGASHIDAMGIRHRVLERRRPVTDADVPDADIIIATWWETAEWVGRLSAGKGAKAHLIQHHEVRDTWPNIPDDRARAVWRLPMHRIAVSRWLVEIGRTEYHVPQIDLVPNAVDHDLFFAAERARQAAPTVGFLYSPVAFKNASMAVRAAERLREMAPGLRCICFGSASRPIEAELPGWIEYDQSPAQGRIREIYSSCDVWLFTSTLEGFGLPLLEAMACRTPVVATPAGAAPELAEEGGVALVPHDDVDAMATAAARFLTCPADEWSNASAAAHRTASKYTWEHSADLFEASLHRAAEFGSGSARVGIEGHSSP